MDIAASDRYAGAGAEFEEVKDSSEGAEKVGPQRCITNCVSRFCRVIFFSR